MELTDKEVEIFTIALKHDFRYSLQYVDYSSNEWTAPARLTPERYDKFMQDGSVKKVRLIMDVNL